MSDQRPAWLRRAQLDRVRDVGAHELAPQHPSKDPVPYRYVHSVPVDAPVSRLAESERAVGKQVRVHDVERGLPTYGIAELGPGGKRGRNTSLWMVTEQD